MTEEDFEGMIKLKENFEKILDNIDIVKKPLEQIDNLITENEIENKKLQEIKNKYQKYKRELSKIRSNK